MTPKTVRASSSEQEPAWSIPACASRATRGRSKRGLAILGGCTPKRPVLGIFRSSISER